MDLSALSKIVQVSAGTDRFQDNTAKIWGLIPLSIKLSTHDTGGALMIFEHANMGKGGPPLHVHHDQDEWFYITQGRFAFEIGGKRIVCNPGDTLLAPRKIPHAWACVSDTPGSVLIALNPAGTFEAFIRDTTRYATLPPPEEMAKAFESGGMTLLGPPMHV